MRILAFGDSLTVGYRSPDEPAPYASFLAPLLPDDTTIAIAGISGETTSDMLFRFDRDLLQATPDRVIIARVLYETLFKNSLGRSKRRKGGGTLQWKEMEAIFLLLVNFIKMGWPLLKTTKRKVIRAAPLS